MGEKLADSPIEELLISEKVLVNVENLSQGGNLVIKKDEPVIFGRSDNEELVYQDPGTRAVRLINGLLNPRYLSHEAALFVLDDEGIRIKNLSESWNDLTVNFVIWEGSDDENSGVVPPDAIVEIVNSGMSIVRFTPLDVDRKVVEDRVEVVYRVSTYP